MIEQSSMFTVQLTVDDAKRIIMLEEPQFTGGNLQCDFHPDIRDWCYQNLREAFVPRRAKHYGTYPIIGDMPISVTYFIDFSCVHDVVLFKLRWIGNDDRT